MSSVFLCFIMPFRFRRIHFIIVIIADFIFSCFFQLSRLTFWHDFLWGWQHICINISPTIRRLPNWWISHEANLTLVQGASNINALVVSTQTKLWLWLTLLTISYYLDVTSSSRTDDVTPFVWLFAFMLVTLAVLPFGPSGLFTDLLTNWPYHLLIDLLTPWPFDLLTFDLLTFWPFDLLIFWPFDLWGLWDLWNLLTFFTFGTF